MFNLSLKKIRISLLLLVVVLAAAVALPASVIGRSKARPSAQSGGGSLSGICTVADGTENLGDTVTFDLETNTGYAQTPDGNSVFMWSYNLVGNDFQTPGPILCVKQGASITFNLTNNNLPENSSIVFPGQTGVTAAGDTTGLFTGEAAASGGSASYSFIAGAPGTYLYHSGTDLHKQVQMGLYGALVVRPTLGAQYAYNDASTEFSEEFILLLTEIDPDLHRAVERGEEYDITTRHDRYWFINGRSFPDNSDDTGVPWFPYQPYGALVTVTATDPNCGAPGPDCNSDNLPILVRYANAGQVNHPFHPHGNHMRIIAQDGRLFTDTAGAAPFENFNTTIAAGQTYDLLFEWRDVEGWKQTGPTIPATIPGLIPSLLNLVFADNTTFYSGDPYLGEQDDNSPGVVIDNECGEFYFPWHSHALNEVQNFDEGFGGMLALVRIDPPPHFTPPAFVGCP
jgi:FtsP/CotA-like multicopper oxidase with cupredoxin domain